MRIKHGKVVFGYRDSFSADPVLSQIIADWLKNFKKVLSERIGTDALIGCPYNLLEDLYGKTEDGHYSDAQIREGLRKFVEILDEMIYAFESDEPEPTCEYILDDVCKDGGESFIRFRVIPEDEDRYESWLDDVKEHYKRVERGRDLFAKYYDNLWW